MNETVRFGLFPSFFYTRDANGQLKGFGIELARSFAHKRGRKLILTEYAAPPAVVRALKADECDVAFMGLDPARASEVDFSAPYIKADFTFLVPAASSVSRMSEIDVPGCRVAVVRDHAMEYALRGKLNRAEWVFVKTPDESFDAVRRGQADVMAGIRPGLIAYAASLAGARVLSERYGQNTLALAVLKGRTPLANEVNAFVLDARNTGLMQKIINETHLEGVDAVPAD